MTALALTILLAILWVAFIGIGYRHGGWRQVVVLAAMLVSYAVLSEWAAPNGRDLSTRFHWSVARTTSAVALLYLLVGTLVLGFLGSLALYRPRPPGATERRLGVAMGALNGGLLLALVLRTLRSYAFAAGHGQALHRSPLSRFLIEDVGYLLLGALICSGIAAMIGLVVTRRDDARERALLASVATPVVARPPAAQYQEQSPVPVPPVPVPPAVQRAPPPPEPIYATAPLIDWPTSPPPGMQLAPRATDERAPPNVPPAVPAESDTPHAPLPIPAQPVLPPRVPPPMLYPVADLIAMQTKPAVRATSAPPATAPAQPHAAPAPNQARPIGPPPSATHPAFVPPTAMRPATPPAQQEQQEATRTDGPRESQPPPLVPEPPLVVRELNPQTEDPPPIVRELHPPTEEPLPPVVRELDVATYDPPPPVVRELDVATRDAPPPIVRELDVTTHDVPVIRDDAKPMPDSTPDELRSDTEGGTMNRDAPAPASASPLPPNAVKVTAAIPTLPPPLPSIPAARPAAPPPPLLSTPHPAPDRAPQGDEAAKGRTGFARVAVARQASGRPDESPQTQSRPPASPEPLQPPLPTGPRVHPCPTCGYPVRDHARYCPNCGSRQGRP